MKRVHPIADIQNLYYDVNISDSNNSILILQDQHKLILDKLLPEIDQHFYLIFQKSSEETRVELQLIYEDFQKFSCLLSDHIVMEEELIFPRMKRNEALESAANVFIEKHDDFEDLIQKLLFELNTRLSEMSDYMSYRMLQNKLHVLKDVLAVHQELEHNIFPH
jgi:iron-sulfur cluster repair protein YtfE (RIC family)